MPEEPAVPVKAMPQKPAVPVKAMPQKPAVLVKAMPQKPASVMDPPSGMPSGAIPASRSIDAPTQVPAKAMPQSDVVPAKPMGPLKMPPAVFHGQIWSDFARLHRDPDARRRVLESEVDFNRRLAAGEITDLAHNDVINTMVRHIKAMSPVRPLDEPPVKAAPPVMPEPEPPVKAVPPPLLMIADVMPHQQVPPVTAEPPVMRESQPQVEAVPPVMPESQPPVEAVDPWFNPPSSESVVMPPQQLQQPEQQTMQSGDAQSAEEPATRPWGGRGKGERARALSRMMREERVAAQTMSPSMSGDEPHLRSPLMTELSLHSAVTTSDVVFFAGPTPHSASAAAAGDVPPGSVWNVAPERALDTSEVMSGLSDGFVSVIDLDDIPVPNIHDRP